MRKFLYFISADHRHLQSRLERLASKGLALTGTDGLFTGEFEETGRTDLRYYVVPYGNQRNFPSHLDASVYGWTLIGGFNGMAIYQSLPCVTPDETALRNKLEEEGVVHYDRHTIPVMLALLFALGAGLVLLRQQIPALSEQWYLSYGGICLPCLALICFALLATNLVTLRSYSSAWVHGLTAPILTVSVFLSLILWQLDNRGQIWFFVLFLIFLALAWCLTFWRLNRIAAGVMPAVCLLILCLGLLFPQHDQTEFGSSALRTYVEDKQVVTLEDLSVDDDLSVSGYRTEGTVLVGKTTYWELSASGVSASCEVYTCATTALADSVSEYLRSVGSWASMEEGFCRDDGATILLRRGKTIAVLSYSYTIDPQQMETIYAKLFG